MGRRKGDLTRKPGGNDARNRAWRAMDVMGAFTVAHLQMVADIGQDNARAYLRRLAKYGYVRKVRDYKPHRAGCHALWRLLRWTGPIAPIATNDGRLYDPNTKEIHGTARQHTA